MNNSRLYEIQVSSNLEDALQDTSKEMYHLQVDVLFLNQPTDVEIMREKI